MNDSQTWEDWQLWLDVPPEPRVRTLNDLLRETGEPAATSPVDILIIDPVSAGQQEAALSTTQRLTAKHLSDGGYVVCRRYAFDDSFAASGTSVVRLVRAAYTGSDSRRFHDRLASSLPAIEGVRNWKRIYAFPRNHGWLASDRLPALLSHVLSTGRLGCAQALMLRCLRLCGAACGVSRRWPFQYTVYRKQT